MSQTQCPGLSRITCTVCNVSLPEEYEVCRGCNVMPMCKGHFVLEQLWFYRCLSCASAAVDGGLVKYMQDVVNASALPPLSTSSTAVMPTAIPRERGPESRLRASSPPAKVPRLDGGSLPSPMPGQMKPMEEGALLQHAPADVSAWGPGLKGPSESTVQGGPGAEPDFGPGTGPNTDAFGGATSAVGMEDFQQLFNRHRNAIGSETEWTRAEADKALAEVEANAPYSPTNPVSNLVDYSIGSGVESLACPSGREYSDRGENVSVDRSHTVSTEPATSSVTVSSGPDGRPSVSKGAKASGDGIVGSRKWGDASYRQLSLEDQATSLSLLLALDSMPKFRGTSWDPETLKGFLCELHELFVTLAIDKQEWGFVLLRALRGPAKEWALALPRIANDTTVKIDFWWLRLKLEARYGAFGESRYNRLAVEAEENWKSTEPTAGCSFWPASGKEAGLRPRLSPDVEGRTEASVRERNLSEEADHVQHIYALCSINGSRRFYVCVDSGCTTGMLCSPEMLKELIGEADYNFLLSQLQPSEGELQMGDGQPLRTMGCVEVVLVHHGQKSDQVTLCKVTLCPDLADDVGPLLGRAAMRSLGFSLCDADGEKLTNTSGNVHNRVETHQSRVLLCAVASSVSTVPKTSRFLSVQGRMSHLRRQRMRSIVVVPESSSRGRATVADRLLRDRGQFAPPRNVPPYTFGRGHQDYMNVVQRGRGIRRQMQGYSPPIRSRMFHRGGRGRGRPTTPVNMGDLRLTLVSRREEQSAGVNPTGPSDPRLPSYRACRVATESRDPVLLSSTGAVFDIHRSAPADDQLRQYPAERQGAVQQMKKIGMVVGGAKEVAKVSARSLRQARLRKRKREAKALAQSSQETDQSGAAAAVQSSADVAAPAQDEGEPMEQADESAAAAQSSATSVQRRAKRKGDLDLTHTFGRTQAERIWRDTDPVPDTQDLPLAPKSLRVQICEGIDEPATIFHWPQSKDWAHLDDSDRDLLLQREQGSVLQLFGIARLKLLPTAFPCPRMQEWELRRSGIVSDAFQFIFGHGPIDAVSPPALEVQIGLTRAHVVEDCTELEEAMAGCKMPFLLMDAEFVNGPAVGSARATGGVAAWCNWSSATRATVGGTPYHVDRPQVAVSLTLGTMNGIVKVFDLRNFRCSRRGEVDKPTDTVFGQDKLVAEQGKRGGPSVEVQVAAGHVRGRARPQSTRDFGEHLQLPAALRHLLQKYIVIGHDIQNDLDALEANYGREQLGRKTIRCIDTQAWSTADPANHAGQYAQQLTKKPLQEYKVSLSALTYEMSGEESVLYSKGLADQMRIGGMNRSQMYAKAMTLVQTREVDVQMSFANANQILQYMVDDVVWLGICAFGCAVVFDCDRLGTEAEPSPEVQFVRCLKERVTPLCTSLKALGRDRAHKVCSALEDLMTPPRKEFLKEPLVNLSKKMVMRYRGVARRETYPLFGWGKIFRPHVQRVVQAYFKQLGLMWQRSIALSEWPLMFLKHQLKHGLTKHVYQAGPIQLASTTKGDLIANKGHHLVFGGTRNKPNCADPRSVLNIQLELKTLQDELANLHEQQRLERETQLGQAHTCHASHEMAVQLVERLLADLSKRHPDQVDSVELVPLLEQYKELAGRSTELLAKVQKQQRIGCHEDVVPEGAQQDPPMMETLGLVEDAFNRDKEDEEDSLDRWDDYVLSLRNQVQLSARECLLEPNSFSPDDIDLCVRQALAKIVLPEEYLETGVIRSVEHVNVMVADVKKAYFHLVPEDESMDTDSRPVIDLPFAERMDAAQRRFLEAQWESRPDPGHVYSKYDVFYRMQLWMKEQAITRAHAISLVPPVSDVIEDEEAKREYLDTLDWRQYVRPSEVDQTQDELKKLYKDGDCTVTVSGNLYIRRWPNELSLLGVERTAWVAGKSLDEQVQTLKDWMAAAEPLLGQERRERVPQSQSLLDKTVASVLREPTDAEERQVVQRTARSHGPFFERVRAEEASGLSVDDATALVMKESEAKREELIRREKAATVMQMATDDAIVQCHLLTRTWTSQNGAVAMPRYALSQEEDLEERTAFESVQYTKCFNATNNAVAEAMGPVAIFPFEFAITGGSTSLHGRYKFLRYVLGSKGRAPTGAESQPTEASTSTDATVAVAQSAQEPLFNKDGEITVYNPQLGQREVRRDVDRILNPTAHQIHFYLAYHQQRFIEKFNYHYIMMLDEAAAKYLSEEDPESLGERRKEMRLATAAKPPRLVRPFEKGQGIVLHSGNDPVWQAAMKSTRAYMLNLAERMRFFRCSKNRQIENDILMRCEERVAEALKVDPNNGRRMQIKVGYGPLEGVTAPRVFAYTPAVVAEGEASQPQEEQEPPPSPIRLRRVEDEFDSQKEDDFATPEEYQAYRTLAKRKRGEQAHAKAERRLQRHTLDQQQRLLQGMVRKAQVKERHEYLMKHGMTVKKLDYAKLREEMLRENKLGRASQPERKRMPAPIEQEGGDFTLEPMLSSKTHPKTGQWQEVKGMLGLLNEMERERLEAADTIEMLDYDEGDLELNLADHEVSQGPFLVVEEALRDENPIEAELRASAISGNVCLGGGGVGQGASGASTAASTSAASAPAVPHQSSSTSTMVVYEGEDDNGSGDDDFTTG